MYSGNVDLTFQSDLFPGFNKRFEKYGYKVVVELGFQCFVWSLLQSKPFGQEIQEFKTWERVGSGSAASSYNAIILAVSYAADKEFSNELYHEVLFGDT